MSSNGKVSVLVPTYGKNRRCFLQEALDSVAHQDHPNVECLVVYDGLWPYDPGILDAPEHFIFVEHAPHKGLSSAVNAAFISATGDYICVLSDDDVMFTHKCRIMAEYLDERPEADVVYALPQWLDQSLNRIATPGWVIDYHEKHPVVTWQTVLDGDGIMIHGTATMYRRRVWEEWDEKMDGCEEYEFHARLLYHGARFEAVPEVTDGYRTHSGQKSVRMVRGQRRASYRRAARLRVRAKIAQWREQSV